MNNIYILILLIVSGYSYGQEFKGRILDKNTNEPVPFAHIKTVDKAYGVVAKLDGSFSIPKEYKETIFLISVIGYDDYRVEITEENLASPIYLSPKSYHLKEISIISPKYKRTWLNDFNNPSYGFYTVYHGAEIATLIHKSVLFPQAQIQKVSVYIQHLSNNNYLRLHLYDYDLVCACPGKEILDSNYIIRGGHKNEWVDIDISNSLIEIPISGLFVSIEGLRESKDVNLDTLSLGAYSKPSNFGDNTYHKNLLGEWKADKGSDDFKVNNVLNLSVKIEVAYDKKRIKEKIKKENSSLKYEVYSKRQIKKLFDSRKISNDKQYSNNSFENLLKSIYKAIENDDIPYMVDHLFVFDKESQSAIFDELEKRKELEHWIPEDEKRSILDEWAEIIDNMEDARFSKIDSDKYKVEFLEINNTIIYVQTDGENWRMLSKYHTGQLK